MVTSQELAWLDQMDARTSQDIRKYGWVIKYVSGGDGGTPPSFAYTVGLFGLGHPELVVVSLDQGLAAFVLNNVGERIRAGRDLIPGEVLTFDGWAHRVTVEVLPNPWEILFAANRHYQRPDELSVPAYQLTTDDMQGRFPWEAGYASPPNIRPRPGTWTA